MKCERYLFKPFFTSVAISFFSIQTNIKHKSSCFKLVDKYYYYVIKWIRKIQQSNQLFSIHTNVKHKSSFSIKQITCKWIWIRSYEWNIFRNKYFYWNKETTRKWLQFTNWLKFYFWFIALLKAKAMRELLGNPFFVEVVIEALFIKP